LGGVTLTNISQRVHLPARERAIGYVPQDLALFPHLTLRQNIVYGVKGQPSARPEISREKLCRVLDIERLFGRTPDSLSGGEKQRVAVRASAPGVSAAPSAR
jgi:molybdate transport system ATP-binding protein